jgi:two-component system OmpR family sensor kinase
MSLRARLLVGLLAIVAAGLLGASLATHRALADFLEARIDEQLEESVGPVYKELSRGRIFPGRTSGQTVILTGTYAELRQRVSVVLKHEPKPHLPDVLPEKQVSFDVGSDQRGFDYRVLASPLPRELGGGHLVVALPLKENERTLRRLLGIEITVGVVVLAALAALGTWVVRLGLRPLDAMGSTADAIAAGDLSRRVEGADSRTEVGRLGLALNAMLGQIEDAFSRRRASEDRLRRFVADASHELRTPLTSIRGYAELFRHGASDRPEDLAMAMRRIEEEAARMGVLVDDLLLLARLDQGRPLEQAPVDLALLAADAVADARASNPDRPIDLAAPAHAVVLGDEPRLRQVAANLLSNAAQHTPPGTPVHVSVETAGDRARLIVRDEGPGLDPALAERVFERFFRADPTRTRATGGSGLGLSIVAAIAEAHGGRAGVEANPGQGAAFVIELPRHDPPSSPFQPEESNA